VAGYIGLVVSFASRVPPGPAIILVAALLYAASVLFGSAGGLVWRAFPGKHLEA
jgi:zinc/manganese transport system permease protein